MGTTENSAFPTIVPSNFFASNPPTGPYGAASNVQVAPTSINLQSEGADMSGGTDSAAIWAKAFTDLPSGGGDIFGPPGVLKLATGLAPPAGKAIRLRGASVNATTIRASAAIDMLTFGAGGNGWQIEDLTWDGNGLANHGLYAPVSGAIQLRMKDVQIIGCLGAPGTGFENIGNSAYSMTWRGVSIHGNHHALRLIGLANSSNFFGSYFYYNDQGNIILGDGTSTLSGLGFYGCDVETNGLETVDVDNFLINGVQGFTFFGYLECPGRANNHDFHFTGTPSTAMLGFGSGGGNTATNNVLIDASANGSIVFIPYAEANGMLGNLVADNSAASFVTQLPSRLNGGNATFPLRAPSGLYGGQATTTDQAAASAGLVTKGTDANGQNRIFLFNGAGGHTYLVQSQDAGGFLVYDVTGGGSVMLLTGFNAQFPNGNLQANKQVYPGAEAFGLQTLGGILHSTGIPSNANGNNNDWAISDNGHLYFKAAGAWAQKI